MSRLIYCLLVFSLFQLAVSAKASAQTTTRNCPVITIDCPDMVESETNLTFKADVSGADAGLKLSYKWTVSEGTKIVSGDETPSLVVRVDGGLTYTVAVEVSGLSAGCSNKAACSFSSCGLRPARLVDTFTNLPFTKEAERLETFAKELLKEPGAQGYILVYAGRKENSGVTEAHAYRLKSRLIKEYDFEDGRITTVDGGYRESRTVELFIVPMGSVPPTATPTIKPEEKDN